MEKRKINHLLVSFVPVVKGIAKTFGKNCEVLLHDVSNLESSVIMIENGHVTGRKIGSPMTDLGLYFLQSDLFKDTDFIANYQTESKDGKKLKSTSIFIRDDKKKIIGFLCINYALDYLSEIRKKIDDFCAVNKDLDKNVFNNEEKEEIFTDNLDDLLERVFAKSQEKVGKPVGKMQKDDKLEVVRYLQKKGVFLVKGNIGKIAKKLNVSRYTIYNYLSEIKPEKDIKVIWFFIFIIKSCTIYNKKEREWSKIKKEIIKTCKAPMAIGPYSQAIRTGNLLFLSGQISIDPETNKFLDGDIEIQTEQALENIKAILEAAGSSLKNVVKVTMYLRNMENFTLVNKVYNRYFEDSLPARACVEVSNLPKNAKIEIEAIAIKNEK